MNKHEYSTAIKKTPYNYLISKKIASMINDGLIYDEIYKKCYEENCIGIESLQRRREITNVVYERVSALDEILLKFFLNDSISTSKFVLVYAIAKVDRLFSEFLLSVYRATVLGEKEFIGVNDFDDFFTSARERHIEVAKWKQTTIEDLATGYRNILVESGLCQKDRKKFYPQNIIINPICFNHIKEIGDEIYLKAILGVK